MKNKTLVKESLVFYSIEMVELNALIYVAFMISKSKPIPKSILNSSQRLIGSFL